MGSSKNPIFEHQIAWEVEKSLIRTALISQLTDLENRTETED